VKLDAFGLLQCMAVIVGLSIKNFGNTSLDLHLVRVICRPSNNKHASPLYNYLTTNIRCQVSVCTVTGISFHTW
jgi:hypothetical protein